MEQNMPPECFWLEKPSTKACRGHVLPPAEPHHVLDPISLESTQASVELANLSPIIGLIWHQHPLIGLQHLVLRSTVPCPSVAGLDMA